MAIPSEKLAQSLDVLRQLQESNNSPVIRSSEISRTHYERLVKNGFLMKVVGGWYIQSDPADVSGDTTAWYISYGRNLEKSGVCQPKFHWMFRPAIGQSFPN